MPQFPEFQSEINPVGEPDDGLFSRARNQLRSQRQTADLNAGVRRGRPYSPATGIYGAWPAAGLAGRMTGIAGQAADIAGGAIGGFPEVGRHMSRVAGQAGSALARGVGRAAQLPLGRRFIPRR